MHYSQSPLYRSSSIIDLLTQLIEEDTSFSHPSYSQLPQTRQQCQSCGTRGCSSQTTSQRTYEPQRNYTPSDSQSIKSLLETEAQLRKQLLQTQQSITNMFQPASPTPRQQPQPQPTKQYVPQERTYKVQTPNLSPPKQTMPQPVQSQQPRQTMSQPVQPVQSNVDYSVIYNTIMEILMKLLMKYYPGASPFPKSFAETFTPESKPVQNTVNTVNTVAEAQQWVDVMKKCFNETVEIPKSEYINVTRERMIELMNNSVIQPPSQSQPQPKSESLPKLTLTDYSKMANVLKDTAMLSDEDVIKTTDDIMLICEYIMTRSETDSELLADIKKIGEIALPFANHTTELMKLVCEYEKFRHKYFDDILDHVSNTSISTWLDNQNVDDDDNTSNINVDTVPTVTINNTTTTTTSSSTVPTTTLPATNTSTTSNTSNTSNTSTTSPSGQSTYLLNSLLDAYKKYQNGNENQEEVIKDTANIIFNMMDGKQNQNTEMLNNVMSLINKNASTPTSISSILSMFNPNTSNTTTTNNNTANTNTNTTTTTSTSTTPPSYSPPISAPPPSPAYYNDIDLDLDSILNEYQSMSNTYEEPEAYITDEYTD